MGESNLTKRLDQIPLAQADTRKRTPRRCAITRAQLARRTWLKGCLSRNGCTFSHDNGPEILRVRVVVILPRASFEKRECKARSGCTLIKRFWPGISGCAMLAQTGAPIDRMRRVHSGGNPHVFLRTFINELHCCSKRYRSALWRKSLVTVKDRYHGRRRCGRGVTDYRRLVRNRGIRCGGACGNPFQEKPTPCNNDDDNNKCAKSLHRYGDNK